MTGLKGKGFLAVTMTFAMLLFLVGIWEWVIAGAVHQLLLSGVTFALTVVAWFFHRRSRLG